MGAKIITEKDFWMCSCGAMPAQLQGVRKSNKKQSGEVYITVEDTSTSSWIDFGCTKSMLLYAMIAAAVVVAAVVITVLIVGTGGIAAIGLMGMMAIGAGAGLLGGIVGAIEGAMLCGQKVAKHRHWSGSKSNLLFTGKPAITGANTMTCDVGGVVQFAPNIKSWTQAIALGGMNYLTKFAACAVGGAAIGAGGEMIIGMAGAFAGGASLALPTLGSIGSNIATTFTGVFGGMRVISGAVSAEDSLNQYAVGKKVTTGDVASAFVEGSVPEKGMVERIATGNAQPSDALILLYFLNIKAGAGKPPVTEEPANNQPKEETGGAPKEDPQPQENKPNEDGPTFAGEAEKPPVEEAGGKKGEAYEDGQSVSTKAKGDIGEAKVIDNLKAEGYTDVVQVQNNSGHGVDVIARNPKTGDVKCVEVKANTSKLSPDQAKGGEWYVNDRLNRAIEGKGHYKIPPNPEQMKLDAQKAKDWISDAPTVDYEVHQVPVDNASGVAGTPKVSPWNPKP